MNCEVISMIRTRVGLLTACGMVVLALTGNAKAQQAEMSFFVSSLGKGNGADLSGLAGADAHCQRAVVAKSLDDLHSDGNNVNKQTALTEKGEIVSGRGDPVNTHDILTGSDPQGLYSTAGGDTTCGNWTKSAEGSAIVGHHDRSGLKDTRHMNSWNSSHGSRGCSQDLLKASGGAGLLYCFAAN